MARRLDREPARPSTATIDKALEVHRRLCAEYGCPIPYFHTLDPLSELMSSLLSHRTRNKDSGTAFKNLRRLYPDWQAVIDAPTADVQRAIAAVTWPELKAPRLQEVLRSVKDRVGHLSLDLLSPMTVPQAIAWLRMLPGVGPKTAAAVLSFSTLRKAALPVDAHHHRVAERLGLIRKHASLDFAHEWLAQQLPADWDAQQVYDNHEVLMLHGQKVCFYQHPACERCVLADLCPSNRCRTKQEPHDSRDVIQEQQQQPDPPEQLLLF